MWFSVSGIRYRKYIYYTYIRVKKSCAIMFYITFNMLEKDLFGGLIKKNLIYFNRYKTKRPFFF